MALFLLHQKTCGFLFCTHDKKPYEISPTDKKRPHKIHRYDESFFASLIRLSDFSIPSKPFSDYTIVFLVREGNIKQEFNKYSDDLWTCPNYSLITFRNIETIIKTLKKLENNLKNYIRK